jgi:hypothetical protein
MRRGCTVAAAAIVIAGFALPTTAIAECNPRNPTACTADSQPQAAAPQPQTSAASPLQLKRFMKLGPARRTASRSAKRRVADTPKRRVTDKPAKRIAETKAEAPARSFDEVKAPLTPKAVSTVPVAGPAVAAAPASVDGTVGFAAATEPWTGVGAFAESEQPAALPPGITIARFDEVNEIDLAADAAAMPPEQTARSDRISVSLSAPANAATPSPEHAPAPEAKQSWLSWLYEKLADGVLTAVLAIRSFFV